MQGGEATHREADDMSLAEREPGAHGTDVVARLVLRIFFAVRGDVGRWIAARVEGNAAIAAGEVAQLRLPAAMVAGKLVHKDDRRPAAGLFEIELHPIIGV